MLLLLLSYTHHCAHLLASNMAISICLPMFIRTEFVCLKLWDHLLERTHVAVQAFFD